MVQLSLKMYKVFSCRGSCSCQSPILSYMEDVFLFSDHTFPPKLGPNESLSKNRPEKDHNRMKRNVDPDDEETENSQIFKTGTFMFNL